MRVLSTLCPSGIRFLSRTEIYYGKQKKKRMGDSPALGVGTVIHIIGWLVLSCRLHFDRSQLFGASPALSENSVQLANPRHGDPNGASRRVESHESYHHALRAVRAKKTTRHLPIRRYRLLGHETRLTHARVTVPRSIWNLEVKSGTISESEREREGRGGGRGFLLSARSPAKPRALDPLCIYFDSMRKFRPSLLPSCCLSRSIQWKLSLSLF